MSVTIIKHQYVTKIPVSLRYLLKSWSFSQLFIQKSWCRFRSGSGKTHRVPYRVWSRHGAYLEISMRTHKVN